VRPLLKKFEPLGRALDEPPKGRWPRLVLVVIPDRIEQPKVISGYIDALHAAALPRALGLFGRGKDSVFVNSKAGH